MRARLCGLGWLLILGCASATRQGSLTQGADYARTLGPVTAADLSNEGGRVLRNLQFEILRQIGPPDPYIETQWRPRQPFADEAEGGAVEAQSRIVMRGRKRAQTSRLGDLFSIDFSVENQLRMQSGEWRAAPATPMFRQWAESIWKELDTQFQTGVRRY